MCTRARERERECVCVCEREMGVVAQAVNVVDLRVMVQRERGTAHTGSTQRKTQWL